MAGTNLINLLDALRKEKNHGLIIFTTFVFDPIFFDGYILRKLKQNNPNATIIVLMDSEIYSTLSDEFTNETGVEYALLPISGNLFHSKIFLFKSESKSKVLLGSHNLTLSGITQNLELCYESDDKDLASECLQYISNILKKSLSADNPWLAKVDALLSSNKNSVLITNESEPILDQVVSLVNDQTANINEIVVFAPYFSKVDRITDKLLTLNPQKIKICIQKGNHNLETKNLVNNPRISFYELAPNPMRRVHSKFIVFRGSKKDLILTGSPNFTSQALLKTSKDGNYETALLLEEDYQSFIKSINTVPISENDVRESKRIVPEVNQNVASFPVLMNFAYFDNFGILTIEYDSKISDQVELTLFHNDTIIKNQITIESGKNTVTVHSAPEKTTDVLLSKGELIISNRIRVCSPKDMKIRTSINLENSKSVQKALSEIVDLEDIANLCYSVFYTDEEKIGDYVHAVNSERIPLPSGRTSSTENLGILDMLNRLFKISVTRHNRKMTTEAKEAKKGSSKIMEKDELISGLIQKLTKKFEKYVLVKTNFTKRYSVYLVISLKLIKNQSHGKIRGLSAVSAITGLNNMIVNDTLFSALSIAEKLEILHLLIDLAKEAEQNLNTGYKFDDESILSQYRTLIQHFLPYDDPLGTMFEEYKQAEKYSFPINDYDLILVEKFFVAELVRLPLSVRMNACKAIILNLDGETNYDKMESGYSKLRLYLSKDLELRKRITSELRSLKNTQNIDAINGIISEYS